MAEEAPVNPPVGGTRSTATPVPLTPGPHSKKLTSELRKLGSQRRTNEKASPEIKWNFRTPRKVRYEGSPQHERKSKVARVEQTIASVSPVTPPPPTRHLIEGPTLCELVTDHAVCRHLHHTYNITISPKQCNSAVVRTEDPAHGLTPRTGK